MKLIDCYQGWCNSGKDDRVQISSSSEYYRYQVLSAGSCSSLNHTAVQTNCTQVQCLTTHTMRTQTSELLAY